jgi:quinoprotein glucose dehydrogenase
MLSTLTPILLGLLQAAGAQEPYTPKVMPASDEGRQAMARFEIPPGFRVDLWAAEPLLANPVAIHPADTGEVYVCESFRLHKGVTDIREHMDWLDDDNASSTVEDMVAMFRKRLGPEGFAEICKERERVRLVRDKDGDGSAETATVFSDHFGDPADGIIAGVLKWKKDVFVTNMPHLWLLRDENGDDQADLHRSLSYGYGVKVPFLGHDLHGLAIGPDGYLYFSCGDRGFHVETPDGTLAHPQAGAVLRCELDGSKLEIYHTGLRNPQELTFDAFGNLFTGDNNGDGGDKAKWIQIVRGADSGWRNGWQWVNQPTPRGFFNEEGLWKPQHEGQPAYLIPPIANITDGPSGLTYNPGSSLPPEYDGNFFLCDFRGGPSYSQIWSFALADKGASFEVKDLRTFVKGTLVTDAEFGPDGKLYFSDWVEGWGQTGKGRIYRVYDPERAQSALVRETQRILSEGLDARSTAEIAPLLAHPDLRVRLRAHLELADKRHGTAGIDALRESARFGRTLFARLHGVWGMGVALRRDATLDASALLALLQDPEAQVRAQAVRMVGELRREVHAAAVEPLLRDADAKVRLRAASALYEIGARSSREALLELAQSNADQDATLRSALCAALARCSSSMELAAMAVDAQAARRVAAVVALRIQKSPLVAAFLADDLAFVREEAARAIYDAPLHEALPALAAATSTGNVQFQRRVNHARWRVGGAENAQRLVSFALEAGADESARAEAVDLLRKWKAPHSRDPLLGQWLPIAERDDSMIGGAVDFLREHAVLAAGDRLASAWMRLAGQQQSQSSAPALTQVLLDARRSADTRVTALHALEAIGPQGFTESLALVLDDPADSVRAAALAILMRLDPDRALPYLETAVRGNREERRAAYVALAKHPSPKAEELLSAQLARYRDGLVPGEVGLELVEACEKKGDSPSLVEQLASLRKARAQEEKLAAYLDSLLGGNHERGREIFRTKAETECMRCHRIASGKEEAEGGQVGPSLVDVSRRLTRLELLEAIVDPNRHIARGYESTLVFRVSGEPLEGVIFEEDQSGIKLRDKDGKVHVVSHAEIEATRKGLSSMPTDLAKHLDRGAMRDLIEFLARTQ